VIIEKGNIKSQELSALRLGPHKVRKLFKPRSINVNRPRFDVISEQSRAHGNAKKTEICVDLALYKD